MSAYLCANDTFDYLAGLMQKGSRNDSFTFYLDDAASVELVNAGILLEKRDRLNGITDTAILVAILRRENITSIVSKYGDDAIGDDLGYRMRAVRSDLIDIVAALKTLRCLEYQSCEHPDFRTSIAARLIECLTAHAIHLLPGYNDAPWGWTRNDAERKYA